jgi:hypothetical protein
MTTKRTEPVPHARWYRIHVELPVTTGAFNARQARSNVEQVLGHVATALALASGTMFRVERPRVKGVERGPRLTQE